MGGAVGKRGGGEHSVNGGGGERLLSKLSPGGNRELIPVFHNPHRKCRPSPSAVARTLEYLEGVPSQAELSGRKEKQVRINIQKILENVEGGNEVIPKSSPQQGMKAQSLQSLFVGEVTPASYQLSFS